MATSQANLTLVQRMNEAGRDFLESLSSDQKSKACFQYLDGERLFWYYPPMNRHGLALRDMNSPQRDLAFALMATGLTDRSYQQARKIISLESVLGPIEKERGVTSFKRDPELYYFTIFGDPAGADPWAWRAEGHHVSLHFSVWKDEVISMTPFFFGANPAEVKSGPSTGLRILSDREDIAFDLLNSLDNGQKSKAIIYGEAPYDILTYNSSKVSLPKEEGLPIGKMNDTQKSIISKLIAEYINQVPDELANKKMDDLKTYGIDDVFFAWAGGTKIGQEHYYRLHGGNFVVEFDNRQGGANHIHSVWRDVDNDFASDIMAQHLLAYHVL
jgi:hypothetical protein